MFSVHFCTRSCGGLATNWRARPSFYTYCSTNLC
nr:MAG TPA: hypothetical protein [Caudoviricetes sp.]DAU90436.1 MAG TPA: hypothetical protein [Caudoviricetes sp.]